MTDQDKPRHREFWLDNSWYDFTPVHEKRPEQIRENGLAENYGFIHVVEIGALLEEQEKVTNLIVGLQLLYAGVPKDAQNFIDQLIKKYGDV